MNTICKYSRTCRLYDAADVTCLVYSERCSLPSLEGKPFTMMLQDRTKHTLLEEKLEEEK